MYIRYIRLIEYYFIFLFLITGTLTEMLFFNLFFNFQKCDRTFISYFILQLHSPYPHPRPVLPLRPRVLTTHLHLLQTWHYPPQMVNFVLLFTDVQEV